jgi:hypothetical protein
MATPNASQGTVRVFISHSSRDRDLVAPLTEFIRAAAGLAQDEIRCTSLKGYDLYRGRSIEASLKDEITESTVIVGLITPWSISSPWVMNELGAAWILSKCTIPILCGVESAPGPLGGAAASRATDSDDLDAVGATVRVALDISGTPPDTADERRDEVLRAAIGKQFVTSPSAAPSYRLLVRSNVRDPDNQLRWSDIADTCRQELWIWGWSCANVLSLASHDAFLRLLDRGVRLRFITLDPVAFREARSLHFGHVCKTDEERVRKDIEDGIAAIARFVRDLEPPERRKAVELRTSKSMITWSGVAVDPDTPYGLLQIESYLYGRRGDAHHDIDDRPVLLVWPSHDYYAPYRASIETLWREADPYSFE